MQIRARRSRDRRHDARRREEISIDPGRLKDETPGPCKEKSKRQNHVVHGLGDELPGTRKGSRDDKRHLGLSTDDMLDTCKKSGKTASGLIDTTSCRMRAGEAETKAVRRMRHLVPEWTDELSNTREGRSRRKKASGFTDRSRTPARRSQTKDGIRVH